MKTCEICGKEVAGDILFHQMMKHMRTCHCAICGFTSKIIMSCEGLTEEDFSDKVHCPNCGAVLKLEEN